MEHRTSWGIKAVFILSLVMLLQRPILAQRPQSVNKRIILPGGGVANQLIHQIRGLDLSEDQSKALRRLIRRARPRGQEILEAIGTARQRLNQQVRKGAGREEMAPAVAALTEKLLDQAVFQARVSNAIRSQLTKEQKAKMRTRARQRGQRIRAQRKAPLNP